MQQESKIRRQQHRHRQQMRKMKHVVTSHVIQTVVTTERTKASVRLEWHQIVVMHAVPTLRYK